MILLAVEFTEYGLTHPEEHLLALTLRDRLISRYAPELTDARFAVREKGKPYIKDSSVTYSVTHTDGCTACAVSFPALGSADDIPPLPDTVTESGVYVADTFAGSCDLGVDIERIATERDAARLSAIATRYFDKSEIALINEASDKCAAFYRIWTGKESMVKCTGEGLAALSFADTDHAERMGFNIREFTLDSGESRFSASLCRNNELLDL